MPILIIIVIVVWIVAMSRSMRSYKIEKERIKLSQNNMFNDDKRVISIDDIHMICVDTNSKKWSYYNSSTRYSQIFEYSQLIDYELIENGNSIVQGRAGSTIVGGALLGGIGAIAGAVRRKRIDEFCSELTLKLFINDINNSFILINLIQTKIKKNSKEYKDAINKAVEFESLLKIILVNSIENTPINLSTPDYVPQKEQLQELKEMLDSGLITQEDYEQKKKQILGL